MGGLSSVLCVLQISELSWVSMTFSLSRARMEKILGAGSGCAVDLLGLQLGTPVSAALGGKDRENAGTWYARRGSLGANRRVVLSWGW